MKMKNLLIGMIVIAVLGTIAVYASSIIDTSEGGNLLQQLNAANWFTPELVSSAVNDIYSEEADIIVATVNGIPIYKKEVEYAKFENEQMIVKAQNENVGDAKALEQATVKYSTEEEDIIKKIARRRLIVEDAKNYGIVFSHEDAMEYITNREKDLQERADNGSEIAAYTVKSDKELFENLNMTKEEYESTVLAKTVIYRQTYYEAVKAYYLQVDATDFITYEEYIDNLLDEAELIIY